MLQGHISAARCDGGGMSYLADSVDPASTNTGGSRVQTFGDPLSAVAPNAIPVKIM